MGKYSDKFDFESFSEDSIVETRRRKLQEFQKNMESEKFYDNDIYTDSSYNLSDFDESEIAPAIVPTNEEITSYSNEGARERIAKNSKKEQKIQEKQEKKLKKQKSKKNRWFFRLTWLASIIVVGIFLGMILLVGVNDLLGLRGEADVETAAGSSVKISVPENASIDDIADILYKNGIISSVGYFKLYAGITSADSLFKQGQYELTKNMDYESIINHLQSSSNRTDTVKIMFKEGMSVLQIAELLKENKVISDTEDFLKLCNSAEFNEKFTFLKDIKKNEDRYYLLEGYLYPDTYDFYVNEAPEDIVFKFLDNFENKIFYEKRKFSGYKKKMTVSAVVEDSGYSLDEILTIASIIQAEALNDKDMYNISSVLHNRLEYGESHDIYTLGCDSTSFYPYRDKESVPKDIAKSFKSRYDTYEISGLPPSAVNTPGMSAITATLIPNDTDYFYFCHSQGENPKAYYAVYGWEHENNLVKAGLA